MAKEVREKNVNGVKPNMSLGKTFDKKKIIMQPLNNSCF